MEKARLKWRVLDGGRPFLRSHVPHAAILVIQPIVVMLGRANEEGTNDVKNVITRTLDNKSKTSIEKSMVWYVDQKFIIITKIFTKDQPEKIKKLEVIWNDSRITGQM